MTRRARRWRTPHRAPRRQATIAQSRSHAQLATPATHDVVISTPPVRALNRAIGAPPIPATLSTRRPTCETWIPSRVRQGARRRTLKRLIQLTFSAGFIVRCFLLNKHRPSATSCSQGRTSTCCVQSSSNREGSARRTRRLKRTCTPHLN